MTFNSWNELLRSQVLLIAENFGCLGNLPLLNKVRIAFKLSDIRVWHIRKLCQHYLYGIDHLLVSLSRVDRLLSKINLTEFKIRKFRSRFKTYHAPADHLKNVTIVEFSKADHAFSQYLKTKEAQYLDRLVAVLYRPARKKSERVGDIRVPFRAESLEADTKKMRKVSSKIKHAILLSFWGCRNHLVERFPSLFDSQETKKPASYGWAGLLLELSGDKFGDLEKTCDVNLYTVLMYLDMKMKAA